MVLLYNSDRHLQREAEKMAMSPLREATISDVRPCCASQKSIVFERKDQFVNCWVLNTHTHTTVQIYCNAYALILLYNPKSQGEILITTITAVK